jgi:hypothetical protein
LFRGLVGSEMCIRDSVVGEDEEVHDDAIKFIFPMQLMKLH